MTTPTPIPGFPGYGATRDGRIWSNKRGAWRQLATNIAKQRGHVRVTLYTPPIGRCSYWVHRLMLRAFDRAPAPKEEACHRNHKSADNRLENLYWGSRSDNAYDREAAKRGKLEDQPLYGDPVPEPELEEIPF